MEQVGPGPTILALCREGSSPFSPSLETAGGLGPSRSPLSTLVDVVFAVDSMESCRALARVTVDVVRAGAPILTGFTQTLVHVRLALVPNEAGKAEAGECVHSVQTGASILARV